MARPKSVDFHQSAGTTWQYLVKFPVGVDFTDGDVLRVIVDKDWTTTFDDAEIAFRSDVGTTNMSVPVENVNWVNIHYTLPENIDTRIQRYIRMDYLSSSGYITPVLRGKFEVGP